MDRGFLSKGPIDHFQVLARIYILYLINLYLLLLKLQLRLGKNWE